MGKSSSSVAWISMAATDWHSSSIFSGEVRSGVGIGLFRRMPTVGMFLGGSFEGGASGDAVRKLERSYGPSKERTFGVGSFGVVSELWLGSVRIFVASGEVSHRTLMAIGGGSGYRGGSRRGAFALPARRSATTSSLP